MKHLRPSDHALIDLSDEREQLATRILAAVEDDSSRLRTIEGIARQTSTPVDVVTQVLETHPSRVRESLLRDHQGRYLYAPRSHPPTWRERLATIRMFVAKTYQ